LTAIRVRPVGFPLLFSESVARSTEMPVKAQPKALVFDVFGTCVDWRSSIAREGEALGRRLGATGVDWLAFADAWRAQYQPQMETVRSGKRPWATLDLLHREALDTVLPAFGLDGMSAADRDELTLAWHRLDPWPDVVEGLTRLKTRFVIAPNSNGHIALMVNVAKRAGLPWDAILGAEIAHAYKPQPAVYLRSAEALGLPPSDVMMVAAHNNDLVAAAACGLQTAFVPRPTEHGPSQTSDLTPEQEFDVVARDFLDLAERLSAISAIGYRLLALGRGKDAHLPLPHTLSKLSTL
jgi:2-haloacid dehalogenase